MNAKFISIFSIICFLINFTLSQLILSLPIVFSRTAGTATIILSIYMFILILILHFVVSRLYKAFWGIGLFDISKFLGGKTLSKIVSGLYTITFFLISIMFLREVSETVKILLFDTTPIIYISIFLVLAMILGSIGGLEGILRACGLIIPIALFTIIITIMFSMPYIDINGIFPVLGTGSIEILVNDLPKITTYFAFIFLYVFVKYIKEQKTLNKISLIYIVSSFILITLTLFVSTTIFTYPYNNNNFFVLYELAKLSNLNVLFIRSEIIYIFTLRIIFKHI